MPQQVRAIPGLTSREQVAYAGWLKGMSRSAAWTEAPAALERVDLTGEADRLTAQLSGGQQRRVGLAQLLVHRADLLLLDEPTAGLDPGQRARFRETLRRTAQDVPVVVSTHRVDDLTDLFDTVVVMDHGRIPFQGSTEAFMALAPGPWHPNDPRRDRPHAGRPGAARIRGCSNAEPCGRHPRGGLFPRARGAGCGRVGVRAG